MCTESSNGSVKGPHWNVPVYTHTNAPLECVTEVIKHRHAAEAIGQKKGSN